MKDQLKKMVAAQQELVSDKKETDLSASSDLFPLYNECN